MVSRDEKIHVAHDTVHIYIPIHPCDTIHVSRYYFQYNNTVITRSKGFNTIDQLEYNLYPKKCE